MEYIERYWRDATPQDAIREPPMVARFRDEESEDWLIDELVGFDRTSTYQWINNHTAGITCQVYDAPDPGEGWRLVGDNETLQDGDEFFLKCRHEWMPIPCSLKALVKGYIYRRRIEQPKPEPQYVPFTWEDREQLRGRWYTMTLSCGEIRECQIEFLRLDRNVFIIGSFPSDQLLEKNATFLDTGEPVGKRVQ